MCVHQKVLVHQDASLHTNTFPPPLLSCTQPAGLTLCSLLIATVLMTEATPRFTVFCSSQFSSHKSCLW